MSALEYIAAPGKKGNLKNTLTAAAAAADGWLFTPRLHAPNTCREGTSDDLSKDLSCRTMC